MYAAVSREECNAEMRNVSTALYKSSGKSQPWLRRVSVI